MKVKETNQQQQNSVVQPKQKQSNTDGMATIVDKRLETIQQKKAKDAIQNRLSKKTIIQKKTNLENSNTIATQTRSTVASIPLSNQTGLPNKLKSGIENLSGFSMDDVKVHYNSNKPAQLQAHAYAQGTDIHLAPNQERHLPHEAWHVVQQKQGRVQPTKQLKSKVHINDDTGLEKEADLMGEIATTQLKAISTNSISIKQNNKQEHVIQREVDYGNLRGNNESKGNELLHTAVEYFFRLDSNVTSNGGAIDTLFPDLIKEPLKDRFKNAENTTLSFSVLNFYGTKNEALAETNLSGYKKGVEFIYDDNKETFLKALKNKEIDSFKVEVMFNKKRLNTYGSRFEDKSLGYLLQTVTHELTVHAENMLNLTNKYWDYYKSDSLIPPKLSLKTASEEHEDFKDKKITRYEFIKFLLFFKKSSVKSSLDPSFGMIKLQNDFNNRETNDKQTST